MKKYLSLKSRLGLVIALVGILSLSSCSEFFHKSVRILWVKPGVLMC